MFGYGNEVGERVHLVEQFAVLIPFAAHLLTAADVCNGVGKAAVEQAQPGRAEIGFH